MPETYTVTKAKYAGEKDNPHGGKLHKFYCSFVDESGNGVSDVYWQRKSEQSPEGEKFYGRIEEGEYGPRFKTEQQQNGGPPRSGGSSQGKDDYWRAKEQRDIESQARMGRAHAQEMSLRSLAAFPPSTPPPSKDGLRALITEWTDWFHQDVQRFPEADGGGGTAGTESTRGLSRSAAAVSPEEASTGLKGRLTQHFNKAGLSKGAQQAIVLYRCRQLPATKDGAMSLLRDLEEGATPDQLLAEITDAAKRDEDGVAIRAAELIPSDLPWED